MSRNSPHICCSVFLFLNINPREVCSCPAPVTPSRVSPMLSNFPTHILWVWFAFFLTLVVVNMFVPGTSNSPTHLYAWAGRRGGGRVSVGWRPQELQEGRGAATDRKINEGSNSSLALVGCIFSLPSRREQIVSGFGRTRRGHLFPEPLPVKRCRGKHCRGSGGDRRC